jgi:hypothetical protein
MVSAPDWQRELRRHGQAVRVATCRLVAVFCSTHALVDMTERVRSPTGHLRIDYPSTVRTSVNRRDAALQDLFGNEPWFLLEGLAYAALGWAGSNPGPTRSDRCAREARSSSTAGISGRLVRDVTLRYVFRLTSVVFSDNRVRVPAP